MIPEWLDLRSAILGALVAYSITILFAVAWCSLCDFADRCASRRRDREEIRRIDEHERRERARLGADNIIEWADHAAHGSVIGSRYHHVEVTHDQS